MNPSDTLYAEPEKYFRHANINNPSKEIGGCHVYQNCVSCNGRRFQVLDANEMGKGKNPLHCDSCALNLLDVRLNLYAILKESRPEAQAEMEVLEFDKVIKRKCEEKMAYLHFPH